jgi:hypothetical protein
MDTGAVSRRIHRMFVCRSLLRRVARIALAAFLVPLLATTPGSAHAHSAAPNFPAHGDFCSTVMHAESPGTAQEKPDNGTKVCAHCPGCTGCTTGSAALPPSATLSLHIPPAPAGIVVATPQPANRIEVVTARPRGPPVRA